MIGMVDMMEHDEKKQTTEKIEKTIRLTPSQTIMAGFAFMIFTGTLLLALPEASQSGESVGFLNALFTATSANCVTGLVVVNTMEHWTGFGKVVILILIQFGALGFMTVMTLVMLFAQRRITLRTRQAIQTSFAQDSIGGMVKLVKNVVFITVIFESAGAVLLAFFFNASLPNASASTAVWDSVYQGIFHSISAFCNAGFDIIGRDGLIPFQGNVPVNVTLMILIVAGGIGFTVWNEVGDFIKNPQKKSLYLRVIHLSLHSKIVFVFTIVLIVAATILFLLLEWSNPKTFGNLPVWQKIQAALFQSVTLRTAGFSTIEQSEITEASQFCSCILMIIGGSSASTAGGMKTVTLSIIVFSTLSALKGRNNVEAFGRTLPQDLLQKALPVASTMLLLGFVSTLLLYFTEQTNPYPHTFLDLLFESCSATGTVGVTAGITPHLSPLGKIILIICMYVGRLSPVTIMVALNTKLYTCVDGIAFPQERVIIG